MNFLGGWAGFVVSYSKNEEELIVDNEIKILSFLFRSWHKPDWNLWSIIIKNVHIEIYEVLCYMIDLLMYQTLVCVYDNMVLHTSVQ